MSEHSESWSQGDGSTTPPNGLSEIEYLMIWLTDVTTKQHRPYPHLLGVKFGKGLMQFDERFGRAIPL